MTERRDSRNEVEGKEGVVTELKKQKYYEHLSPSKRRKKKLNPGDKFSDHVGT